MNPRDAFHDTAAGQGPTGTSPFDRVVSKLQDVRQTAKGVRARCPAHDDTNPSLDCDLGDDGRVLLNCRSARCSTEQIVTALGLTVRDLFPPGGDTPVRRSKSKKKEKTKHPSADAATKAMEWAHKKAGGRMTRQHDYHDAAGTLVMRTMRFDYSDRPKQFGQSHRTDDGSWVNSGMPSPRPLFRLPELVAADPDDPVLMPEGEKCVEECVARGFTATTSSQGAEAPKKTD